MTPESMYINPDAFDRFLDRVKNGELKFLESRPIVLSWVRDGVSENSDPRYVIGWKMDAKSKIRMIQLADSDGHCCNIYDIFTKEDFRWKRYI